MSDGSGYTLITFKDWVPSKEKYHNAYDLLNDLLFEAKQGAVTPDEFKLLMERYGSNL